MCSMNMSRERLCSFMMSFTAMMVKMKHFTTGNGFTFIRGYYDNMTFTFTLANIDPIFDVVQQVAPDKNFDVSVYITKRSGAKRRKRSTGDEIGPFYTHLSDEDAAAGLDKGEIITMTSVASVMISREDCEAADAVCVAVVPGPGSSYKMDLAGDIHYTCLDITPYKNCIGKHAIFKVH